MILANASFESRSQPKPEGGFGPGQRNVLFMPSERTIILDVVAGEIACVEILDRDDVRRSWMMFYPKIEP